MPELVIKYKDKKTLDALIDFSKYFNFSISTPKSIKVNNSFLINGVEILSGDNSIDTADLNTLFSNSKISAESLREKAWQRKK
jgi:hypothetical protein